ncbi:uncharacterized protein LOC127638456 [Xyrauchen texanus]|uniref:uncharacterized protein LOC127638456 n=1 Tax=Xyrauchen texanus TaxID=154827 RepID=UPI002241F499|nr:uncharacterized protein LOC127638456 [Xyrauchen texanus]
MAQPSQQWSHKDTETLIRWRMDHEYLFSGWRNTCRNGWQQFIHDTILDLDGPITALRAKKKWENLKCKYKVLQALAKDVATVKPESWRWYRLMKKAVDGDNTDIASPKPTFMSDLADDESECVAHPNKNMYQVEMGSDIVELQTHSVIEVKSQATVVDGGTSSDMSERMSGKPMERSHSENQDELDIKRAKIRRERKLLEKEHVELDRERVLLEQERAAAEREKTALERDRKELEKDRAAIDRERASLEQDRARLERDRAALERDRETFTAMTLGKNGIGHVEAHSPYVEDRKRLIYLFEQLIERF